MIEQIESYGTDAEFQPADIAGIVQMKRSTCKGWIDALPEVFKPVRVEDTGYRFYGPEALKQAAIIRTLKSNPIRRTHAELRMAFSRVSLNDLWSAYRKSTAALKDITDDML